MLHPKSSDLRAQKWIEVTSAWGKGIASWGRNPDGSKRFDVADGARPAEGRGPASVLVEQGVRRGRPARCERTSC